MDGAPLRASDADRDQALVAPREHMVAGRLTLEEFCERAGAALRARDISELARLHDDLPAPAGQTGPRRRPTRFASALLSRVVRRGKLRLRGWAVAASVFGDLDFDLRDATPDQGHAVVTVVAALGNADVYVPEGVNVDVRGLAVFGHLRDWGRDAGQPDAPSIHVRMLGLAGTVDVWRVPLDLRGGSYREILRALRDRRPRLPA